MTHFFEEMKRFAPILILISVILSGCYDNHDATQSTNITARDNCDISLLQSRCQNGLYLVTTDLFCLCRITSSDREGNFYRSIVVEDGSGGAEIKIGTYNNAAQYPVGLEVALCLNGTALMFENGVMQVGLPPQNHDSSPREMEAQSVIDKHIIRTNSTEPMQPFLCDIASLDTSMCGRFVAVENLHYAPIEGEEKSTLEEYSRFMDEEGNTIFIYVSPYADFATDKVPTSKLHIQGILYHETVGLNIGKQLVIKPRFRDDISTSDSAF